MSATLAALSIGARGGGVNILKEEYGLAEVAGTFSNELVAFISHPPNGQERNCRTRAERQETRGDAKTNRGKGAEGPPSLPPILIIIFLFPLPSSVS